MPKEVRILIADDHPLFRQAVRQAVETHRGFKVIQETGDGAEALRLIRQLTPDVAILDIEMPGLDGLSVSRDVLRQGTHTEIIILTAHRSGHLVELAMHHGVKGYLLKDSVASDIVACIQAVLKGQLYVSPALAAFVIGSPGGGGHNVVFHCLTAAERRVLALVAEHKSNKQIAGELFISQRTVETHRRNICEKLKLRGSHRLLQFALEHKSAPASVPTSRKKHSGGPRKPEG